MPSRKNRYLCTSNQRDDGSSSNLYFFVKGIAQDSDFSLSCFRINTDSLSPFFSSAVCIKLFFRLEP